MSGMTNHHIIFLHLDCFPVCKEESSPEQKERVLRLIKKEPEHPLIKEEQEDLFQTQEDDPSEADGTMLTLPTVKTEAGENTESKPPATTSPTHRPAGAEDCETIQSTSDAQLLSSPF